MVTRVPVVTRERLLMFLAIGSCLMALMLKISRCLLPRAVTLRVQEMGQQQRQEPWPLFGHPLSPPRWRIRSTPFAGHGRHGRDLTEVRVDSYAPIIVAVHYGSPHIEYLDRGKSRVSLELADMGAAEEINKGSDKEPRHLHQAAQGGRR
jgi:hypothetical protein